MELIRPDITPQELLVVLDANIDKTQELLSYFSKNSAQYDEIHDSLHTIMLAWAELKTALDRSNEDYIDFIFEVVKKDVHDELLKKLNGLEMSQKVELNGGGKA